MNQSKLRFTGLLSENRQGQIWVQDPVSGNYHELDDVGGVICRMLKRPMRMDELIDALTEEYEVERTQCEADVKPFLERLRNSGLLKEESV